MTEIIDLSQEIFAGMPVFAGLPEVKITLHASHEEWDGLTGSETVSPAVYRLELGEHTGTHVDALNHMARPYRDQSIDTMPLTMFYTEGLCLDLSPKGRRELIEPGDLAQALAAAALEIKPGDTVLLYTDHYRRAFGTAEWLHGPGISAGAAVVALRCGGWDAAGLEGAPAIYNNPADLLAITKRRPWPVWPTSTITSKPSHKSGPYRFCNPVGSGFDFPHQASKAALRQSPLFSRINRPMII